MVLAKTLAASWLLSHPVAADSGECAGSQCVAESVRSNSLLQKAQASQLRSSVVVEDGEAESSDMDAAMMSAMGAAELKELAKMKRDSVAERNFLWVKVQKERRRQFEQMRHMEANVSLLENAPVAMPGVDCGHHRAESCAACSGPGEDPWSSCKGDCRWHGGASGECIGWPFDPKIANVGRLLILTDGGNIYRGNSDGSDHRKFIDSNTPCPHMSKQETQRGVNFFSSRPSAIAVDENDGRIFWTDWMGGSRVQAIDPATDPAGLGRSMLRWSFNASVMSAPLDGSTVTPIVTSGEVMQIPEIPPIYWEPEVKLGWPHYLALDKDKKKIYWTDKKDLKIQRSNYDGSEVELDFHTAQHIPGGIVVDSAGERIYYSEGHKIYYVPTVGGEAKALISSLGIVGGMDFDPLQNFVYWTTLGTTRNPGGVLRAKGYRSDVTRREYCGINMGNERYMKDASASCEHAVYVPYGEFGMGQGAYQRGPIMTPFDVKGDFQSGVLFWSGREVHGTFREGLGGKVYRSSLCAMPEQQGWEKPSDGLPRGDINEVAVEAGDAMYPPYVHGIALFPQSFDFEGSVPIAGCTATADGFTVEPPSTSTCQENYEWRDLDGKTCMDYAKDTSLCTAGFHDADGMLIPGANAAPEVCCACGADRSWLGPRPTTTTTTTTTPMPTPAAGAECDLGDDWYFGADQEIRDHVKNFVDCLQAQCRDQDGSGLLWGDCVGWGLTPGDSYCDFEEDFGITLGQACPKSCGMC